MSVYSLESAIVDLVLNVPFIPNSGGDALSSSFSDAPGGGIYTLLAARRCGVPSTYLGRIGVGPYGRLIQELFAREDILTLLSPLGSRDTGFCITLVEPNSERTFITYPGVESEISADLLIGVVYSPEDYLVISGYDLTYSSSQVAIVEHIMTMKIGTLVFDPSPLVNEIPSNIIDQVLKRTDLLSLNEREFKLLGGDASALLSRLAPEAVIILRKGSQGASFIDSSQSFHVDAPRVDAVDSTGAGDIHVGTLIAMRIQNQTWADSLYVANVAAAISVSKIGLVKVPTLVEILNSSLFQAEKHPTLGSLV